MKKLYNIMTTIIMVLCFGVLGVIVGKTLTLRDDFLTTLMIILCGFSVFYLLHILIHEAGHMVFGLLTGYKLNSYRVGSWMLINRNNHLEFKKYSLAGTAGQCLMDPPDYHEEKFPCILYNLGGGLMNIIFAVITLIISFYTNDIIHDLCIINTASGLIMAITNLFPIKTSTVNNDGANTLELIKYKESKKALYQQLKIGTYLTNNIRYKDMDKDLFDYHYDHESGLTTSIVVMEMYRLIDNFQFEEAKELINTYKDHEEFLGIYKLLMGLYHHLLGLLGYGEVLPLTSQEEKFLKMMKSDPGIIAIQYGIDLLEKNDIEKANDTAAYFHTISKRYPYQCELDGNMELMKYIYSRMN